MVNYELITEISTGQEYTFVKKTAEDGSVFFIPIDLANSDYQAYLAYLAQLEEGDN